jgi:chorismate mutase
LPPQLSKDRSLRNQLSRRSIDETDQQIVKLLNQRAKIVAEVGEIKQKAHMREKLNREAT